MVRREEQDNTLNTQQKTLLKHQTVSEVEKKLREKQKNRKDKQVFEDVISQLKVAERNAKELKRSGKNKFDSTDISQNDVRKDFDKEKLRIEIKNSEEQIRTVDVVEKLQGDCGVGKLRNHAEKRKITPEKEPGIIL